MGDVVDSFDKKVASIWILIALGATKTIEHVVQLIARFVDVEVIGVEITLLALFATLTTAGTTALILWKTTKSGGG